MGQYRVTAGGCWVTATNKGVIQYAEFNSNVIQHLGSRRYRLYQVAAVLNTKRLYPTVRAEQIKAWIVSNSAEASHLCRYARETAQSLPDGSEYTLYLIEEVKGCFNPDHMVMEASTVNRSRIRCRGGVLCEHRPNCILVAT